MINIIKSLGLLAICVTLLAGCGKSSLIKGNEAFRSGDYASAESHWRELAKAGGADAQHNLGVLELHRDDAAAAARWWQQAVAQEFVPAMLALARLELMSGRRDAAVSHYRRAARWGNDRAASTLEALGEPAPPADLRMAYVKRLEYRKERIGRELDRPNRNESLSQMLDKYAYLASEKSD
ncbi:hypothetical protein [Wenzhouxiangella sp. EGI_FJ10305]|uniref:hypothetical protein n=1 Tax=Wenzhouxiangella sp. EGI_FJ10305 TaxID=3243768 RepID=UPI0035DAE68A